MFPLEFPQRIIARHARSKQRILDPFCGRGTTNFAARLAGLESVGIDNSPVAAAITAAKLSTSDAATVIRIARGILQSESPVEVPRGEFWRLAFHPRVLSSIVRLRRSLLADCSTDARKILNGIILGALHGPRSKQMASYFSNQCPRTFSPKPRYAVSFWTSQKLLPPEVDVMQVIRRRAKRFLQPPLVKCQGECRLGDSRNPDTFGRISTGRDFDWVITSPPYYGMRTYLQDQWLRLWFLGGPSVVNYASGGQLNHMSAEAFSDQLATVWANSLRVCRNSARLVIRFGGIRDRMADPLEIVKASLKDGDWRITNIHEAGSADCGKRQANAFLRLRSRPMKEYDIWARVR